MSFFRAIFRIGQRDDGINNLDDDNRPVYPPTDSLHVSLEVVIVTLALGIVSYLILSAPFFSIRRPSRFVTTLNAGGWVEAVKQLRYVRSADDFKQWWDDVKQLRRQRGEDSRDEAKLNPRLWEKVIRARNSSSNGGYESDRTVRAKGGGGGGRSAPSTPLMSMFRPAADRNKMPRQRMHGSTGHLSESPPSGRVERFYSVDQQKDSEYATPGEGGREYIYDDDFRPETDHDRFEKAWYSHIRFAEYRHLVLPPDCKLIESTSNWKEVARLEQRLLRELVSESNWNKVISYVRNAFDDLYAIYTKLFSKERGKEG